MAEMTVDPMRVAKHLEAKVNEVSARMGQTETQNAILNAALEQAREELEGLMQENENLRSQLQEFQTKTDEGDGDSTPYADAITPHGPGVETPHNNQEDAPKFSDHDGLPHQHDSKGNHI